MTVTAARVPAASPATVARVPAATVARALVARVVTRTGREAAPATADRVRVARVLVARARAR